MNNPTIKSAFNYLVATITVVMISVTGLLITTPIFQQQNDRYIIEQLKDATQLFIVVRELSFSDHFRA